MLMSYQLTDTLFNLYYEIYVGVYDDDACWGTVRAMGRLINCDNGRACPKPLQ